MLWLSELFGTQCSSNCITHPLFHLSYSITQMISFLISLFMNSSLSLQVGLFFPVKKKSAKMWLIDDFLWMVYACLEESQGTVWHPWTHLQRLQGFVYTPSFSWICCLGHPRSLALIYSIKGVTRQWIVWTGWLSLMYQHTKHGCYRRTSRLTQGHFIH